MTIETFEKNITTKQNNKQYYALYIVVDAHEMNLHELKYK